MHALIVCTWSFVDAMRRCAPTTAFDLIYAKQGDTVNDAILHAIFGDGCAVAVVGGRTARSAEPGSLAVLDNRSWLVSYTLHTLCPQLNRRSLSLLLDSLAPLQEHEACTDLLQNCFLAGGELKPCSLCLLPGAYYAVLYLLSRLEH